jgi:hypothetical protein
MILTRSQQALFWRTFSAAVRNLGIADRDAQTAYRRQVLHDETGKDSLKLINHTTDYDRVMTRLALDANDYQLAARFDIAFERRWSYMCEVCATQIGQIIGGEILPATYIAGICRQAGFAGRLVDGSWWLDLPLEDIVKLFQILDTHRRRLLKREGVMQVYFYPALSYRRDDNGQIYGDVPDTDRRHASRPLRIS